MDEIFEENRKKAFQSIEAIMGAGIVNKELIKKASATDIHELRYLFDEK